MSELNQTELGANETEIDSNETMPVQKKVPYKFRADSGLFWLLIVFGLCFISFILVFQVVLTPIKVVGVSMQPTINSSVKDAEDKDHCDIVYFAKEKSYSNNDIVIVSNPNTKYIGSDDEDAPLLIKRIIALGGQSIKFFVTENHPEDKKNLYYDFIVLDEDGNNINLDQSYIDSEMYFAYSDILNNNFFSKYTTFKEIFTALADEDGDGTYTYYVPENKYFVMGDNRNDSGDSRLFGAVDSEDICGKVHLLVPYGKSIFSSIWTKLFGVKLLNEKWLLQTCA